MKTLMSFLLGAAACAVLTTERGRRMAAAFADEAEAVAHEKMRELTTAGAAPEGEDHDDGRSAADAR